MLQKRFSNGKNGYGSIQKIKQKKKCNEFNLIKIKTLTYGIVLIKPNVIYYMFTGQIRRV